MFDTFAAGAAPIPTAGDWATVHWPRGLARAPNANEHAVYLDFAAIEPAALMVGQRVTLPNGLPNLTLSATPFAMALRPPMNALFAASVSRVGGTRLHVNAAGASTNFPGEFSDPSVACLEAGCIAVVAETSNALTVLSSFPGPVVIPTRLPMLARRGARASRPAIVAVGTVEFAIFQHVYDQGTQSAIGIRLTNLAFDRARNVVVATDLGTIPVRPNQPNFIGNIAATKANANYVVVAAAANDGVETRVTMMTLRHSFQFPATVNDAVEFILPARSTPFIGLARSAGSVVFTVQTAGVIGSLPIYVSPATGVIAVRRPADAMAVTDPLGSGIVAHSLTDGPLTFAAYDTFVGGRVPARQALGVVVGTCLNNDSTQCRAEREGTRYCATCMNNDCINWVNCTPIPDGGVDSGMADVSTDARADSGVIVSDVGDGSTNASADAMGALDVPSPFIEDTSVLTDVASAGDATTRDSGFFDGMPVADGQQLAMPQIEFGGGACACRTLPARSRTHSNTGSLLVALCALSIATTQSRRKA